MEARKNRRQGGAATSKAELKVKPMFGPEGFGPEEETVSTKNTLQPFKTVFFLEKPTSLAFVNVKLIILSDRKVCKGKREIPRKR